MMVKKFLLALAAMASLHMGGAVKIVMMSDIHSMAEKLVEKPGEAFDRYAASDMRMIKESAQILRTVIDSILVAHPDVVMISGDLTKDGERLSHEFVVSQLERLRTHGIKALVIPGNHDISNANAQFFNGSERHSAPTVTRDEFRQLYAQFGYGTDAAQDSASLSYAAEPVKGLVVIGIDSNRDEENLLKARGDSVNTYHTAGRVKESTLQWITDRASEARSKGKRVVTMMHHHLINHFDGEARLLNKYVVADHERVRDALVAAGVHVIFTGHLHLTDIARDYCGDSDSITEVATGSLVTYPFHYRTITISADSMSVATHQIKSVASNAQLLADGKRHVEQAVPGLVNGMVNRLTARLGAVAGKLNSYMAILGGSTSIDLRETGKDMANAIRTEFAPLAPEAFIMIYEGNEGRNPKSAELLAKMEKAMEAVIDKALPSNAAGEMVKGFIIENAVPRAAAVLRSALEDRNHIDTPQEVVVDDHTATFHF